VKSCLLLCHKLCIFGTFFTSNLKRIPNMRLLLVSTLLANTYICSQIQLDPAPAGANVSEQSICTAEGDCYPLEFQATAEFKPVRPGQRIEKGLHVSIDFETGIKQAKLLEDENKDKPTSYPVLVQEPESKQPEVVIIDKNDKASPLNSEEKESMAQLMYDLENNTAMQPEILETLHQIGSDYDVGAAVASYARVVLGLLTSDETRSDASRAIGVLCSNNPDAQAKFIEAGAVEMVWAELERNGERSLLYALGNLVRSNIDGLANFIELKPSKSLILLARTALGPQVLDFVTDLFDVQFD
jgi:nucleotide exchange factor SIL1